MRCTATAAPSSSTMRASSAAKPANSKSTSVRSRHGCGLNTTTGVMSGSAGMSMFRLIDWTARFTCPAIELAVPVLVTAVVVRGRDCTRRRVVELVEQHQLPGVGQLRSRVCEAGDHIGDDCPLLRAAGGSPPGGSTARPGMRAVTPDGMVLQLAAVDGDVGVIGDAVPRTGGASSARVSGAR